LLQDRERQNEHHKDLLVENSLQEECDEADQTATDSAACCLMLHMEVLSLFDQLVVEVPEFLFKIVLELLLADEDVHASGRVFPALLEERVGEIAEKVAHNAHLFDGLAATLACRQLIIIGSFEMVIGVIRSISLG